ncbi:4Fe-4S binding protein [Candidatus Woesearchaeota archaeon]|nr:4Fe-4S binding protein [Candidatus Woesearchaeota archaeon]
MITDFLNNVADNKYFYLNGTSIKNLQELHSVLEKIGSAAFQIYVNNEKNDFYNWIYLSVGDKKLARQIKNLTQKENFTKRLNQRLVFLKRVGLGKESEFTKVTLPFYAEKIELALDREKCVSCEICKEICPHEAIDITKNKKIIDSKKCSLCGLCVPFCPVDAIKLYINGKEQTLLDKTIPKLPDKIRIRDFEIKKMFLGNINVSGKCPDNCEECISACPLNLIIRKKEGIKINEEDCVLCGACKMSCPENIIEIKRNVLTHKSKEFSAAWIRVIEKLLGVQKKNLDLSQRSRKKIEALMLSSDLKSYLDKNDKIKKEH